MERNELLNWAIKGLEYEIISLDTQINLDKQQIKRVEKGYVKIDGIIIAKLRKNIETNLALIDELERKLFALKFERDLND